MRPLRPFTRILLSVLALAVLGLALSEWRPISNDELVVLAAGPRSPLPPAPYLQNPDGMAQYGAQMEESSSPSQTLQALSDWHSYATQRAQWGVGLTASLLDRAATADWNAHQAGSTTITAQQLADATTNLINSKLSAMTAQEQQAMFEAMMSITTIKGRHGLNDDVPHVSATQGGDGRWTVTVSPQAFTERKLFYQQSAPGMVSSGSNFYPGEAILVFYSLASGDVGFGGDYPVRCRQSVQDMTAVDMTNNYLFGENGYMIRRPLPPFLTEQAMGNFFSNLGF